jgi:hypothetical protein
VENNLSAGKNIRFIKVKRDEMTLITGVRHAVLTGKSKSKCQHGSSRE